MDAIRCVSSKNVGNDEQCRDDPRPHLFAGNFVLHYSITRRRSGICLETRVAAAQQQAAELVGHGALALRATRAAQQQQQQQQQQHLPLKQQHTARERNEKSRFEIHFL